MRFFGLETAGAVRERKWDRGLKDFITEVNNLKCHDNTQNTRQTEKTNSRDLARVSLASFFPFLKKINNFGCTSDHFHLVDAPELVTSSDGPVYHLLNSLHPTEGLISQSQHRRGVSPHLSRVFSVLSISQHQVTCPQPTWAFKSWHIQIHWE